MAYSEINVHGAPEDGPYACPCCAYITLTRRAYHETCPVCDWEDDGQDDHDADEDRGGPNCLSLTEARENFKAFGASQERRTRYLREPLPHEFPDDRSD
ncbi:CPCC family cysteine-rich protein [Streptomyces sp. NBC_01198]|uniref:CPCC family cysteine-rich protein n=1 Tax=Streptomyces sp. NBC_01198 TaxID=2903769 RepID=UPI002E114311|nr:CPCC family cysteine-rich protein [Streptomyces sp. NBC_01198]